MAQRIRYSSKAEQNGSEMAFLCRIIGIITGTQSTAQDKAEHVALWLHPGFGLLCKERLRAGEPEERRIMRDLEQQKHKHRNWCKQVAKRMRFATGNPTS